METKVEFVIPDNKKVYLDYDGDTTYNQVNSCYI